MTFDPAFLSNLILVLTGFGGAFLAALWISLVIWTYRDIRTRARDPSGANARDLLVAVLNLPGVLVYLILRPPRTLEEEYQRTLKKKPYSRHWKICLFARAVNAASRMTGRFAQTVTPNSRRPVRTATG